MLKTWEFINLSEAVSKELLFNVWMIFYVLFFNFQITHISEKIWKLLLPEIFLQLCLSVREGLGVKFLIGSLFIIYLFKSQKKS